MEVIYIFNKLKSIIIFIKDVNTELTKNDIKETRAIPFGKHIHFKGKAIPLGKVIIDDENSKILIYETFKRKDDGTICRPDVNVLEFKDLQRCKLMYEYELIQEKELFYIMFNDVIDWKSLSIEISSKKEDFYPFRLDLNSVGKYETLIDIYKMLNKIVEHQKNSIRQYTIS